VAPVLVTTSVTLPGDTRGREVTIVHSVRPTRRSAAVAGREPVTSSAADDAVSVAVEQPVRPADSAMAQREIDARTRPEDRRLIRHPATVV
jgi:hypothetical protein